MGCYIKSLKVAMKYKELLTVNIKKSYDRLEISDFILFHLNVPYGELFSKNTIKSPASLSFL